MHKKIPIILCIDAEPDLRLWAREERLPWRGFEGTYGSFSRLRPRLASVTGSEANFSWFLRMDPQVADCYGSPDWVARRYAREIEDLRAHGDEIGLHAHAWRWTEDRNTWIADHGDQEWVDRCVKTSFDAYRGTFQKPCFSFRFGDGWMNNATLKLVEDLGARFDLTLEPGLDTGSQERAGEISTGHYPDYATVPQNPYQPADPDFRRPAPEKEGGFWMIPLSTHRFYRGTGPQPIHKTLNLGVAPRIFAEGIGSLLRSFAKPYLALVVRSDVSLKPKRMERMVKNFDHLLSHPLADRFVFCRPSEAMEYLGLLTAEAVR